VNNQKIANNSATTEARDKISTYLEFLEFYNLFDACWTNFENYQIWLNKISHRFRVTTIEMKGKTRCKLTIISESAICKKFLGQIWSYAASL
jgi:hypothetical protein